MKKHGKNCQRQKYLQILQIWTRLHFEIKKDESKRCVFFDDSDTEDEGSYPLPAAPEVPVSPIKEPTSRAGNSCQPLARESGEAIGSATRAGNYSQPLARESGEAIGSATRAGNYSQPLVRESGEAIGSTSRSGIYTRPRARESAEAMNSTSRAGIYTRPLARESAEAMNSAISRSASSHSDFNEAVIRKLLANQEIIKDQMGTLVKLVYDLKKLSTAEDSPTVNSDNFPINGHQQLQYIEGQLEQEDFRTAVINTLSLRGGTTVKESVWRIMNFLLTNDIARQINWRGINGKAAFKDTTLKTVINAAVRKNKLTATATDQEVEHWTKRWLQLAKDRDGGRRARERI
ncbi:uncharacterized protein [Paramisgurnus dabryanus]|uniref:uncharacterized protein isoform X2 n=1 Tax=Paramisgurnus dabryanus TaxID=90735 RepID=UPI0031F36775